MNKVRSQNRTQDVGHMTKKERQLKDLEEKIELTSQNILTLKKAKKNCSCDEDPVLHYHVLIHYDSESGDEYLETSDAKHESFINELNRELERLSNRFEKMCKTGSKEGSSNVALESGWLQDRDLNGKTPP